MTAARARVCAAAALCAFLPAGCAVPVGRGRYAPTIEGKPVVQVDAERGVLYAEDGTHCPVRRATLDRVQLGQRVRCLWSAPAAP